ncbi:hypothetical protein [Altericista sp. CCNU0014]|uniref:hypothetical protein n=1 Tax=Altericista sp. CCNU0014 TaxID=3082949 RepID=UPI00384ADC95
MSLSNKLSPMASYYVRRLIQSSRELLLQTTADSALSQIITLEPEEILNRLVADSSEHFQRINNLEILARAYQNLSSEGKHPQQLQEVEKQIVRLLGFPDSASTALQDSPQRVAVSEGFVRREFTVAKVVEILKALLKCGEQYLGPRISKDYFVSSCPQSLQQNGFSFQEDFQLKVSRSMTDTLQESEVEDFKEWIKAYINRCSNIIHGFDNLVNQEHLAYCSISRQEIQLAQ